MNLADAIAEYALDPLGFVLFAFPWGEPGTDLADSDGPREWQADELRSIGERLRAGYAPDAAMMPVLEARASGHGIGKSALVAWLVWWSLCTCADSKVVVTANTEPQLRTKTWPEVAKWGRLLIVQQADPWFKVSALSVSSTQTGHEKIWRGDAVTWSETNMEAFAGLHNQGRRIMLVFDEASGIPDRVWEVAEGALTDEGTEIIWCVFGNPTQPGGRFFQCFNRERHRWNAKQIDSRTVSGTNKAQLDQWVEMYGEDSDFVRVRVRGVFPRAGSMQFIGTQVAEAACKREVSAGIYDPLVMGVDPARFGDDQSVIFFRKGRDARTIPPIRLRGVDTMALAARVMEERSKHNADAVMVDGGGVGGGVVDRLRQLKCPNLFEVQFGAKADRGADGADGVRYKNKRAEIWGAMREWLQRGGIPDDQEMVDDLGGPQYSFNTDNEIVLEPKEAMKRRGLASPDNGDALALTFAYQVAPSATAGGPDFGTLHQAQEYDPWE